MVDKYKAALRAWLIDHVREAIRIERMAESSKPYRATPRFASEPQLSDTSLKIDYTHAAVYPGRISGIKKETWDATNSGVLANEHPFERSFEQMEADALKSQEKHYEPIP